MDFNYEDRKESDIRRDIYIKSLGIEVYRIEWNEINSDKQNKDLDLKLGEKPEKENAAPKLREDNF